MVTKILLRSALLFLLLAGAVGPKIQATSSPVAERENPSRRMLTKLLNGLLPLIHHVETTPETEENNHFWHYSNPDAAPAIIRTFERNWQLAKRAGTPLDPNVVISPGKTVRDILEEKIATAPAYIKKSLTSLLAKIPGALPWRIVKLPGLWQTVHAPTFKSLNYVEGGNPVDFINDAIAKANSVDFFLIEQAPELFAARPRPSADDKGLRTGGLIDWCVRSCPNTNLVDRFKLALTQAAWCKKNLAVDERLHHLEIGAGNLKQLIIFAHCLLAEGIRHASFYVIDPIYRNSQLTDLLSYAWNFLFKMQGIDFELLFTLPTKPSPTEKKPKCQSMSLCDLSIDRIDNFHMYKKFVTKTALLLNYFANRVRKFSFEDYSVSLRENYDLVSLPEGISDLAPIFYRDVLAPGETDLHVLARTAGNDTSLEECTERIEAALKGEVDINAQNAAGKTALDVALESKRGYNINVISALINAGAIRLWPHAAPVDSTAGASVGAAPAEESPVEPGLAG
jgi:hypothetical protein